MRNRMEQENRIRILLVDDSPEQRRDIIAVLDDPRLDVVEADSGEAGLALLKAGEFAVVLIDIRMPGMTGFQLAERIRELEPDRIIPIIFITTAQVPEAYMRKGYSLGAMDFLIFPVIPEIFRAKVEFFAEFFQRKEIQERQAAELEVKVRERTAELHFQNAVTKSLTDNATSGLFMLDQDQRISFMNPAAEHLLGRSFDEVQGKTLHEVAHSSHPEGNPCAVPECRLVKALGSDAPVKNLGEIFLHKDGHPLFVSCSIAPLHPDGVPMGSVVEFQDVTDHKAAENLLKRSEDRYRRLFETAQDGILILDAQEGRIMDVNPFLAKLLGYSKEELLSKELWEIGLFKDIDANREAFKTLQEKGYVRYDDLPLKTKDGQKKEVEFVSNVYKVGDGEVVQCNIRDVTERKQTQEALHDAEENLRQSQKTEALGKLSGGIAHDFNNLLTAINGYADLCLGMEGQEGLMREYLSEILKAGQRASTLTHQLLAFSRKQILAPKVLNLSGIVTEVLSLLRRLIGENIKITTILDHELWLTRADPGQIHQVLLNLAVNARDALPNGGEIIIRTRNVKSDEFDPLPKDGQKPLQYAMLSVSDNGTGMNSEVMARIFDPFFTTKDFGKGSGMGLATVDGIVKQSGGQIKVESVLGEGSTFSIYLHRVDGEEEKPETRAVLKAERLRGTETILMVEDDAIVRNFTRRTLELHGYKVLEAEDGENALFMCEKHEGTIHLLLTDILMPGMNGRELADRFKMDHPHTPTLFMSGYTDEVVVHMGLLEEGDRFIQKPFAPAYLVEIVREALDGRLQTN